MIEHWISSSLVHLENPSWWFQFTIKIRNHQFSEPAYPNKSSFSTKSDRVEKNGWHSFKPSIFTFVAICLALAYPVYPCFYFFQRQLFFRFFADIYKFIEKVYEIRLEGLLKDSDLATIDLSMDHENSITQRLSFN